MELQGGTLKTLRKMKVPTSAGSHSCCVGRARETDDLKKETVSQDPSKTIRKTSKTTDSAGIRRKRLAGGNWEATAGTRGRAPEKETVSWDPSETIRKTSKPLFRRGSEGNGWPVATEEPRPAPAVGALQNCSVQSVRPQLYRTHVYIVYMNLFLFSAVQKAVLK